MEPYTTDEILRDLADLEVIREFEHRGNIILDDEAAEIGKRVGIRFLGWLNTLKVTP